MAWMTGVGKKWQLPCTGVVPKETPSASKLLFPPIIILTSILLAVPLLVRAFLLFLNCFMHLLHYQGNAGSLGARFCGHILCGLKKEYTERSMFYLLPGNEKYSNGQRKRTGFLFMYKKKNIV